MSTTSDNDKGRDHSDLWTFIDIHRSRETPAAASLALRLRAVLLTIKRYLVPGNIYVR